MEDGARVDVDEYEKDSARDFALWKAPKPGETSWETPIGPGRPGWHIECSVMAMEELGETFDLHAGGEDLIFPHHENEIAQSEALTGKPFAHFWFHVRFLLVEGEKMSKSLGNFYTLRDLVLKGHKPSSIRFLLASVPYRNQLNFTFDGLKQAASSVEALRTFRSRLASKELSEGATSAMAELAEETVARMRAALDDDLNTAEAQAAIFDMLRKSNTALDADEVRRDDIKPLLRALEEFDEIFAVLNDDDLPKMKAILEWAKAEGRESQIGPDLQKIFHSGRLTLGEIIQKNKKIEDARQMRDFKTSDDLRAELAAADVAVKNTKDGLQWDARYMTKITPLCPVAVKLNQSEVHAPDHATWGFVSCDRCEDKFALGPNRIYGSRTSEKECVKQLEDILKTDHQQGRPHANSYELEG
jgi:cysteinyl-tRNA synthetase